jgi:hypothetical protein
MGAKNVSVDDFDPLRFKPVRPKKSRPEDGSKKGKKSTGLDPAIFAAFAASDPAVAKRKK